MNWNEISTKQRKVVRILTNGISQNRLAHAYLFEGNAGVGKRETAVHLVKRYFCSQPNELEPCHQCSECKRVESGNHPDVHIVEPDGQSVKIEQIRGLQKEFAYRSVEASAKKAYVIHHADTMTVQAANSLLKFLEEPSGNVIAVLTTENKQKILNTILSRCQVLNFLPLKNSEVMQQLTSQNEKKGLACVISRISHDVEYGKELLEDEWFIEGIDLFLQVAKELITEPEAVLITIQSRYIDHFKEKEQHKIGLEFFLLWYRDVMMCKLGEVNDLTFIEQLQLLNQFANALSIERIHENMSAILDQKQKLSRNTNHLLVMEQLMYVLTGRS